MQGIRKIIGNMDARERLMCLAAAVLVSLMCVTGIRCAANVWYVQVWKMDNAVLRWLVPESFAEKDRKADNEARREAGLSHTGEKIDWSKVYPFAEMPKKPQEKKPAPLKEKGRWKYAKQALNKLARGSKYLEKKNKALRKPVDKWHKQFNAALPGIKEKRVELARHYDELLGMNIDRSVDVLIAPGGYLEKNKHPAGEKYLAQNAQALKRLQEFCEVRGIQFFYVQAPGKTNEKDLLSGTLNFNNENTDRLLAKLDEAGVPYYDMREALAGVSQEEYHAMFSPTDHHWKTTSGIWGANFVAQVLNEHYGCHLDTSLLEPEQFDYVCYERSFLGSAGRAATLARVDTEDIYFFYPKHPSWFHYEVPYWHIDTEGDFSITYNKKAMEESNIYKSNMYGACNYGSQPLIRIVNQQAKDKHKLLIIRDSYSNPETATLALTLGEVDILDVRYFNGSVETYIERNRPDFVMVQYYINMPGDHRDKLKGHPDGVYDFR